MAERMYAAYEQADSAERARLIATSAEKFAREKFGLKGGGKLPRDFDPDTEPRSLAQVKSLGGVASLSFDGPAAGAQGGVAGTVGDSSDGRSRMASPDSPGVADHPYRFDGADGTDESFGGPRSTTEASHSMPAVATLRDRDVLQPDGGISQLTISPQSTTGRQEGVVLILLAAFDAGSYAAMLIVETPDESQRASGVLGTFPTADEACRYAVEYGMAEIDQLA